MKTLKILFFACMMSLVFGCKKDEVVPEKPKVFYSEWILPTYKQCGASNTTVTAQIDAPQITREIMEKGIVQIYGISQNSSILLPIPQISINILGPGGTVDIIYEINLGKINLYGTKNISPIRIRYIVIPQGAI